MPVVVSKGVRELVVESLEPDEAGYFVTNLGVIGGMISLQILQHIVNGLVHHPPVEAGVLLDVHGFVSGLFLFIQLVRSGGGGAKIVIDGLAAPRGLDQQDGGIQLLSHGEPESEFRTDLVLVATVTNRQRSRAFVAVRNGADIHLIRYDAG